MMTMMIMMKKHMVITMKNTAMVLMSNRVISEDDQGFVMSHGDHNHYFFKKDLTAEQIKAAQDNLKHIMMQSL